MHFSTILVGAFAAVAAAQTTAVTTPSGTPTTASSATSASVDPAQTSLLNCLSGCRDDDVNCRAKCVNVPYPNQEQANATNTCAAACDKKGTSADDTLEWANCVASCIGTNYYSASGGTPQATSGSGSGSGSGSSSGGSGSSGASSTSGGSGGSANTASGTGAAAATSTPAGAAVRVGASAVGLIGFLAAFMAL